MRTTRYAGELLGVTPHHREVAAYIVGADRLAELTRDD